MEQLTQYIEKFKDGLPELFENVLTSYQDKINSDFADEYDIPEHEYVRNHPLIHMNKKLFDDIKNYDREDDVDIADIAYNNLQRNIIYYYSSVCTNNLDDDMGKIADKVDNIDVGTFIKMDYPDKTVYNYDTTLPKNEYVISMIVHYGYGHSVGTYLHKNGLYQGETSVTYFTNYGRFIGYFTDDINIIYNEGHLQGNLLPLTYKFPKLFLDVINAFRNESTDDMQKCCEKYNILLQKGNNTSRYDKKIQSLEEENTKLKKEIELLKLQMEEQRKLYMA